MGSDQVQQERAKADEIVHRAGTDAGFRQKLRDDPEGTLRAEGLSNDEIIGDFVREQELGEVGGYRMDCTFTCVVTTCTNSRLASV